MATGGSFLIENYTPADVFTPEDYNDEHRAIARTTEEFFTREVAPNLERIQHQEPGVAVGILRKSAELGLTAVCVPEEYGGMEMDLISMLIVAEGLAKDGSYAGWHGAHSGIGTMPLLLFGTAEQKKKYLPRLASAELFVIGAELRALVAENRRGQQRGVDRSGLADGECAHRHAAGHLRDGEQRVESLQRFGFHRHAEHGQRSFRRAHARQMRRAARAGDDDFQPAPRRLLRVFEQPIRRAMRGDDLRLERHAEFFELRGGVLHGFPVGLGTHDEADECGKFFTHGEWIEGE